MGTRTEDISEFIGTRKRELSQSLSTGDIPITGNKDENDSLNFRSISLPFRKKVADETCDLLLKPDENSFSERIKKVFRFGKHEDKVTKDDVSSTKLSYSYTDFMEHMSNFDTIPTYSELTFRLPNRHGNMNQSLSKFKSLSSSQVMYQQKTDVSEIGTRGTRGTTDDTKLFTKSSKGTKDSSEIRLQGDLPSGSNLTEIERYEKFTIGDSKYVTERRSTELNTEITRSLKQCSENKNEPEIEGAAGMWAYEDINAMQAESFSKFSSNTTDFNVEDESMYSSEMKTLVNKHNVNKKDVLRSKSLDNFERKHVCPKRGDVDNLRFNSPFNLSTMRHSRDSRMRSYSDVLLTDRERKNIPTDNINTKCEESKYNVEFPRKSEIKYKKKNKYGLRMKSTPKDELQQIENLRIQEHPSQKKVLHEFKVLVIGDVGTGKTSIIHRYINNKFCDYYKATIGTDYFAKLLNLEDGSRVYLKIWDLSGEERAGFVTRIFCRKATGAFIVFDVTRKSTYHTVMKWKRDLSNKVYLPDGSMIPCILLANKCDERNMEQVVNEEAMSQYCRKHGFDNWFHTSAKEDVNIEIAFKSLIKKVKIFYILRDVYVYPCLNTTVTECYRMRQHYIMNHNMIKRESPFTEQAQKFRQQEDVTAKSSL